MNGFTPRFANGKYRDCKWCGGKGCLSCEAEADKEYDRQFPNGPKPIATFKIEPGTKIEDFFKGLKDVLGPDTIMAAKKEGEKRAAKILEANPIVMQIADLSKADAVRALGTSLAGGIIEENMIAKSKTHPVLKKAMRAAKKAKP